MRRHVPILTLSLIGPALLIHGLQSMESLLTYERGAIAQGQYWRLLTCHWCHLSFSHLFWNVLLVAIAGTILERQSQSELKRTIAFSLGILGPLLFVWLPGMASYVGLSGLAAALVATTTTKGLLRRDHNTWIWAGIAILLLAKIIHESIDPRLLLSDSDGLRSVPRAHAIGAVSGLVATLPTNRQRGNPMATETRSPLRETPPLMTSGHPNHHPG